MKNQATSPTRPVATTGADGVRQARSPSRPDAAGQSTVR